MSSHKKAKIILGFIAGLLFWPALIGLGMKYGWWLPSLHLLTILGVLLQLEANKIGKD